MTVRPRASNAAYAGHHRHPIDKRRAFTVFYKARGAKRITELAGWYWRPADQNPLLGDAEDHGPFTSSRAAYRDAITVEN